MKRRFANEELPPRPFRWSWNSAAGRLEPIAKRQHTLVRRWHWGVVAVASAFGLIYGSLLPFRVQEFTLSQAWRKFQQVWADAAPGGYSSQDVAINVLIAVPFAFSLMGSLLLYRRRTLTLAAGVAGTIAICVTLSIAVEFAQVWIDTRVSSLRDIAAQIAGAAVGGMLWLAFGEQFSRQLGEFFDSREPASRVVWLLNAYVIGLVVWSLLPLDLVTNVAEIGKKYQRGQIEFVPFTFPYSTSLKFWHALVTQTVIFVPVGIWATIAGIPHGATSRNPWSALSVAFGLNAGVEFAQLFVKSRYTSSTDVLLGIAGCGVGIVATHVWLRKRGPTSHAPRVSTLRSAGFWFLLTAAYAALLVGAEWAPFEFTRDRSVIQQRLDRFADIPFRSLQASMSDVGAMFLTISNFGWYVPLGALAAMTAFSTPFPRARWATVAAAACGVAAVAFVGELGQTLLPGKIADLTEALIRLAGGLAGLAIVAVILSRWSPRSEEPSNSVDGMTRLP